VYKGVLVELLKELGHEAHDFGTDSEESVDYPDFIRPVAVAVAQGEYERGIVLGGSGNGEAIVANKVRGIRCALCWDTTTARLAREHNDANVISIGQRVMGVEEAKDIVRVFLSTGFDGGRHARRIAKIEAE
jgi:ribose 5-phosphate isomerase B